MSLIEKSLQGRFKSGKNSLPTPLKVISTGEERHRVVRVPLDDPVLRRGPFYVVVAIEVWEEVHCCLAHQLEKRLTEIWQG